MNKVRLSKDKMSTNHTRLKSILLTLSLLALIFVSLPVNSYAQVCPADFNGSLTPTSVVPSEPENEAAWTDVNRTSHGFSITVKGSRGDLGTVNLNISAGIDNGIFTKIYANMLAMIPAFATAPDQAAGAVLGDPSDAFTNWKKFYCIDGLNDREQGKITIGFSGSAYDEETITKFDRICDPFELPPPGETLCPSEDTTGFSTSKSQNVDDTMAVPYYGGPREILTKVANIVNDQYCASANSGTDCINENYFCDTTQFVPQSGDVAAKGKDGICKLKTELWQSPKFQLPYAKLVDILCTNTINKQSDFSAVTTNLSSKICMYNPGSKDLGPVNPNDLARFETVTIGSGSSSNEIPYDIDLFADRGETTNPDCPGNLDNCLADGYLRRLYNGKILQYTKSDIEKLSNLSAKLGAGLRTSGDAKGLNDPWTFDFVDKLGTIDFLAEETRLYDPALLPAGLSVMQDRENTAYLRIANADNGALFINGAPVGVRPFANGGDNNTVQYKPFISTQLYGPGYVTMTVVRNNGRFIPHISINGGNLLEVPFPGNAVYQYPQAAFMNSRGDVFAVADTRGQYYYVIYNSISKSFSPPFALGEEFGAAAKFTIDTQDQIHVLGQTKSGTNELRLAKFDFRTADNAAPRVGGGAPTALPRSATTTILYPRGLNGWASLPMSMQVDKYGTDHIIASVSVPGDKYWFENDLYYTTVSSTGVQGPLEIAASAAYDYSPASGYLRRIGMAPENEGNYISHQLSQSASSVAIDPYNGSVYVVYINYMLLDGRAAYQAAYTKRLGPNQWQQNIKLSDRSDFQYSMVHNIFVDRYGNVGFTVWDRGTKFNLTTRKFDAAGDKMCIFDHVNSIFVFGRFMQESLHCNNQREDIAIVVAPSNQTSANPLTGKFEMQFRQGSQLVRYPPR